MLNVIPSREEATEPSNGSLMISLLASTFPFSLGHYSDARYGRIHHDRSCMMAMAHEPAASKRFIPRRFIVWHGVHVVSKL